MALPAKLQNDLRQFQRLQQDLNVLDQQRGQMDLKLRETNHTLEELKALPEDAVIYRSVGNLLVKSKGRSEVEGILTEEKETLEVRVKALERQVNHLKERYETMQQELSRALQAAGVMESPEGGLSPSG
ncbi:Prefoldin, beta subunit [mine drainage metagenome]|uniref:Prefoldin subunit beta n=1 Tax=mine drainage metagenome TaxID=410659 RepID=T0ZGX4_9ZZZZ